MEQDNESPEPPGSFLPSSAAHPSPAEYRRDGWTAERQAAFLTALAACGCVRDACKAVGMSHVSAYALRSRPSAVAFRAAWDAALDCAMSVLEDAALSRAIAGVARPIFFKGEQVGEWRHHDERLAMFLLRYRRPLRFSFVPEFPPPIRPPSLGIEVPDADEAMGWLDWHIDDLTDDGDPPPPPDRRPGQLPRADDGVNFGNFADESDSSGAAPGASRTE